MLLYEMAFSLGIPLYKLLNEMPYDELQGWFSYFEKRPPQWRDDLRTYHILRGFGEKRRPEQVFTSLVPILAESKKEKSVRDALKNSSMLTFMRSAVKGERLEIFDKL